MTTSTSTTSPSNSPFSRKSVRTLIRCPGPSCEQCRVATAIKIVNGRKLCTFCAKPSNKAD